MRSQVVDAMEIMVLSILAPEARCDYDLEPYQESLITTVNFYVVLCLCYVLLDWNSVFVGGVCGNVSGCWALGQVSRQIWQKESAFIVIQITSVDFLMLPICSEGIICRLCICVCYFNYQCICPQLHLTAFVQMCSWILHFWLCSSVRMSHTHGNDVSHIETNRRV